MSRSGAHEAFHDHRLDMLIRELTRPSDPLRIDVQLMPARIVLAGLEMYRIMPGLPPGAEVLSPKCPECNDSGIGGEQVGPGEWITWPCTACGFDFPETHIEPPLYPGDPMEADAEYLIWDPIEERWLAE